MPVLLSRNKISIYFGVQPPTINHWVAIGRIPKRKDGQFDQDACRLQLVRYDNDKLGGRTARTEGLDPAAEKAKLTAAQTVAVTLKNEIAAGQWVRTDDVIKAVEGDYTNVKERILVVPGSFVGPPDITPIQLDMCRMEMKDLIHDALNELSDPNASFTNGKQS